MAKADSTSMQQTLIGIGAPGKGDASNPKDPNSPQMGCNSPKRGLEGQKHGLPSTLRDRSEVVPNDILGILQVQVRRSCLRKIPKGLDVSQKVGPVDIDVHMQIYIYIYIYI